MDMRPLVGLSAAAIVAVVVAVAPVSLTAAHPAAPVVHTAGAPIAQSVILDGRLTTPTRLALHYVVAGNTAVYSASATGDPILEDGGELGSVRVSIDGRLRGGSDAGAVTCAAHAPVREYYDQFPVQSYRVRASTIHRARVVARYCTPDGTESKTIQRIVIR